MEQEVLNGKLMELRNEIIKREMWSRRVTYQYRIEKYIEIIKLIEVLGWEVGNKKDIEWFDAWVVIISKDNWEKNILELIEEIQYGEVEESIGIQKITDILVGCIMNIIAYDVCFDWILEYRSVVEKSSYEELKEMLLKKINKEMKKIVYGVDVERTAISDETEPKIFKYKFSRKHKDSMDEFLELGVAEVAFTVKNMTLGEVLKYNDMKNAEKISQNLKEFRQNERNLEMIGICSDVLTELNRKTDKNKSKSYTEEELKQVCSDVCEEINDGDYFAFSTEVSLIDLVVFLRGEGEIEVTGGVDSYLMDAKNDKLKGEFYFNSVDYLESFSNKFAEIKRLIS